MPEKTYTPGRKKKAQGKWSSISLLKSLVEEFNVLRKGKEWSGFMREILNIYKLFKQGLIVEKHDPAALLPSEPDPDKIACPARIQLPDGWYCAKNAPKIVKLRSLQVCEAHLKWYEVAQKLTKKFIYVDCGAEQKIMEDGRVMYKCPKGYNVWVGEKECKESGCQHVKTMRAEQR